MLNWDKDKVYVKIALFDFKRQHIQINQRIFDQSTKPGNSTKNDWIEWE